MKPKNSPMRIRQNHHVLAVHSFAKTDAFFVDLLGFEVVHEDGGDWRFYRRDETLVMAGTCLEDPLPRATGSHSYFAYFEVDDVDSWFRTVELRIEGTGAILRKALRDEPWGQREFALESAEGHRVMIGQAIRPHSSE